MPISPNPFRDPHNPLEGSSTSLATSSPYGPPGAEAVRATGSNMELLNMEGMHSRRPEATDMATDRPRSFYNPPDRSTSIWSKLLGGRKVIVLAAVIIALVTVIPLAIVLPKQDAKRRSHNLAVKGLDTNVPNITSWRGLIDPDTPPAAFTSKSLDGDSDYVLVFSDEFNTDGRSFYAGDDPFWEGVDLHYWQTNNLEWYDPKQITTRNGSVEFRLERVADPTKNHNMEFSGGMMATWNRFCFTGGRVETSVMLPGESNVVGLWPAVWTLGNLGRVGYGATLDGLWPYSYDVCDIGTLANQTLNGLPEPAHTTGEEKWNHTLSFLPGQRLSRCTCQGEDHPGPIHKDGSYVGRSAPEIDLIEATVEHGRGVVSQSSQVAPFDDYYQWNNASANYVIGNSSRTVLNTYLGGVFQQAVSAVTETDQGCYEAGTRCFSTYMVEYKPGFDNAYVSWVTDGALAWTLHSQGQGTNDRVQISSRPIPQEPMYLLANLGISRNFGGISENLALPVTMRVDYIRVYQPRDAINIGCDPTGFPTTQYIEKYKEMYHNANLTTWVDDFKQKMPKNKLIDKC